MHIGVVQFKVGAAFEKEIRMKADILNALRSLHKDESGQDLIEYALVAALIALAATLGMKSLANSINNAFNTISTDLSGFIS